MAKQKITIEQLDSGLRSKIITAVRDMAVDTGDVVYTGVGFKPTSIICLSTVEGTQFASWGMADSTKAARNLERDGGGSSNFYALTAGTKLAYIQTTAGNMQSAIVKSYDADGFTLTWTKTGSPTAGINSIFMCFR